MRRVLITALASAAVLLAGCSVSTSPEVTFFADGEAVRASPQILCEIGARECLQDDDAVVRLDLRLSARTVQVSVDTEVADTPWGVVFSYLDRDGERVDASSEIFFPAENRLAYTLRLPEDAERLLFAAVQKLAVVEGDQLLVSGYWVLQADAA